MCVICNVHPLSQRLLKAWIAGSPSRASDPVGQGELRTCIYNKSQEMLGAHLEECWANGTWLSVHPLHTVLNK